jgi:hypothetical protein
MKTTITKYAIAGMAVLLGIISWMTVDWAIKLPNFSNWLIPSIFFTLFFIMLVLSAILIRQWSVILSILAVSFFASLYFAFSFWHFLILFLCFLLTWIGLARIIQDLNLNIKLSITKSVRTGKSIIILALSIAIASQYYTEVRNSNQINIIPKLKMGSAVNQILPMVYPNLKNSAQNDLTVDQFISEIAKQNTDSFLAGDTDKQKYLNSAGINNEQITQIINSNQDKILEEERKNFSQMAGMTLSGNEKISDVFSEMINNRINDLFSPSLQGDNLPFLPLLAAFILFLTVASLGSVIGSLAGYFLAFVFWLMRKMDLVKISKTTVEMEIIE